MTKRVRKLRVVVAEPGKPAEVREIDEGGDALRAIVGGWLECLPLWDGEHDIWINEEGKLLDLEPNRMVRAPGCNGEAWDIVGTLVVAAHNDEGDTTSLSRGDADRIADALTGVTTHCRPLLASEVQEPSFVVADWPEDP